MIRLPALAAPVLVFMALSACAQPRDTSDPSERSRARHETDSDRAILGTSENVHQAFQRWTLREAVHAGRGRSWAEISQECRGRIETNFALDRTEWSNAERKRRYFSDVDQLIEKVGNQLLAEFSNPLGAQEKELFLRALRALAWQESRWQHYLRHGSRYFVLLSGGSYNKLDDWGITQVARSGFSASQLLNKKFFETKGHCSIGSTLYHGFLEYYTGYVRAKSSACNPDPVSSLVGAYNLYSSGASVCHDGLSPNTAFRDYQRRAMAGFRGHFSSMPWKRELGTSQ